MSDSPYHRFNSLKILAYSDKLRQIADGGYPYPIDVHVYPSNVCNHACSFCVAAGTMIDTPRGNIPIERLVVGDTVYGPSGRVNVISAVSNRPVGIIYEIKVGARTLVCSGEHPILTQDGWKQAQHCTTGDSAVVRVRLRSSVRVECSAPKVGDVPSRAPTLTEAHEIRSESRRIQEGGKRDSVTATVQMWLRSPGQEVFAAQSLDGLSLATSAPLRGENRAGSGDPSNQDDHQQSHEEPVNSSKGRGYQAGSCGTPYAGGCEEHSGGLTEANAFGSQPDEEPGDSYESDDQSSWLPEAIEEGSRDRAVVSRNRTSRDLHGFGGEHFLGRQEGARLPRNRSEESDRDNRTRGLQQQSDTPVTGELRPTDGRALPKVQMAMPRDLLPEQRKTAAEGVTPRTEGLRIAGIQLERGLELQPIAGVRRIEARAEVYNFSCSPDQAYEANGVVVHNCMFIQNGEQENFPVKLPRPLILRIVDDAARIGAALIEFSGGGEPLLNRHTLEAMQSARATGRLKVALTTNGSLLTPEVAAQVDYIRVSLNAGTAERHRAVNHAGDPRHPGDWQKIINNMREAVAVKRQDMGIGFVIDHENWREIVEFVALAADVGVDFVHIRPAFYYDADSDQHIRDIMQNAFDECETARLKYGDKIKIFALSDKFDGYWTPRTYDRCRAVLTGTVLRATGDFAVCQDRTDLNFGNEPSYAEGASFEDVWHSAEHKAVVESIVAPGILDTCPRCVWNSRNNTIKSVFLEDDMRLAMV